MIDDLLQDDLPIRPDYGFRMYCSSCQRDTGHRVQLTTDRLQQAYVCTNCEEKIEQRVVAWDHDAARPVGAPPGYDPLWAMVRLEGPEFLAACLEALAVEEGIIPRRIPEPHRGLMERIHGVKALTDAGPRAATAARGEFHWLGDEVGRVDQRLRARPLGLLLPSALGGLALLHLGLTGLAKVFGIKVQPFATIAYYLYPLVPLWVQVAGAIIALTLAVGLEVHRWNRP